MSDDLGDIDISDSITHAINMMMQAKWNAPEHKPYVVIKIRGKINFGTQELFVQDREFINSRKAGSAGCDERIRQVLIDKIYNSVLFVDRKSLCENCLKKYDHKLDPDECSLLNLW